ncbi:MAG: hypothetical protein IPK82_16985 [Polyangiaceae bacterium]|nr:hypothetical protein [Polyangiaceae bacterium]
MHSAWQSWLTSLADDAAAALGAAHAYAELDDDGRDAWLDALAEDAPRLEVPRVALYGPLLAVEADPARRVRMGLALGDQARDALMTSGRIRTLRGIGAGRIRVAVLVRPLYLKFVRILTCRYSPDDGFSWARHEPIATESDAPPEGSAIDGVTLEATPSKPVIEELAHAILAQKRRGEDPPEALYSFADLFDAHVDSDCVE